MQDLFQNIATRIVREQALIMGPLAWVEAQKVSGLAIVDSNGDKFIEIKSDSKKEVVNELVDRYDRLFGRASHEVSREVVATLVADMPPEDVPESLR